MAKSIFIAGHNGMVGSALLRQLSCDKSINIVTANKKNLDLTNQQQVNSFFKLNKIDEVYLAAAKVGGISANNNFPANFILDNLMIQSNVINAAYKNSVKKLLFLGSSCIYPKFANQPIKEEYLLTGKLEETNEAYAIAKIAGIKLCESFNRQYDVDYRSIMPTNLYGEGDNFHEKNSHVIPGLIRRFHQAKEDNCKYVKVWGTGKAFREFLHVDDMASASIHIMNLSKINFCKIAPEMCSHINIGTGVEHKISELAEKIKETVGFKGKIIFDTDKPDGTPRKLLNIKKLETLGWKYKIDLDEGLRKTYKWYLENHADVRI